MKIKIKISIYEFLLPPPKKLKEKREIVYASFTDPETLFILVTFMRGLKAFFEALSYWNDIPSLRNIWNGRNTTSLCTKVYPYLDKLFPNI